MTERCFIVAMSHSWGKGKSIQEALRKCKKVGGSGRFIVYMIQGPKAMETSVDSMGGICRNAGTTNDIIGEFKSASVFPKDKCA